MKICIRSPARLHLGLIDPSGTFGRRYGSIGVAIKEPAVDICAERSDEITVFKSSGTEIPQTEVEGFAKRVLDRYGIDGGIKIEIERDIPRHVGLGSTTQMALSVGTAVARLYGIECPARDLARSFGLGKVSGIGTAAFEAGGFIVDCGLREGQSVPTTMLRLDFPEDWRFLVVIPRDRRGLDERGEERVLRRISAPPSRVREICRLLLMKMVPAVIERDIENFGEAMTRIQVLVGKSFSAYQGGLYYSELGGRLVKFLLDEGAYGSGQSSWGPTIYGIVEGEREGRRLGKAVKRFLAEQRVDGDIYCVAAQNEGASISDR